MNHIPSARFVLSRSAHPDRQAPGRWVFVLVLRRALATHHPKERTVTLTHRTPASPTDDRRQTGASLVEYALLVALIAVVCIASVALLGRNSSSQFTKASAAGSAGSGSPTTTAPSGGCPSVHADGYATGPGYGWQCYSPTAGPYNIP